MNVGKRLIPPKKVLLFVIILLGGYFLRVKNLVYQPAWSDEVDVILFSAKPFTNLISEIGKPGHNGPLYYLLVHIWFAFVGMITFTLRYFSVLFGVLSIAVAYQFGRKLLGFWSGISFSLFIATSPYLVWYSQDGKMYSLLLFITLLAMTLLLMDDNERFKNFRRLFFLGLCGISFYLHIVSIILLPVYGFVIIVSRKAKALMPVLFISTALIILSIPIAKWVLPMWLSSFQTGHQYYHFHEILGVQLLGFSVGTPHNGQIVAVGLFMFLFILGMIEVTKSNLKKMILPIYLFFPIITLYLISLGMPFYTDRYLIFTAPAFYAICILGIRFVGNSHLKISVVIMSIAVLLNIIAITFQASTLIKSLP